MLVSELFIKPRRDVVYKQSTFDYFIDVFNGKTHIYESVYYFEDEPSVDKVIVDKIYLDFDIKDDDFFKNTRKVAKYLHDRDIKFYIRFSGRGFHIFIMLNQKWLNNPKIAIKQYVNYLHQETNTTSDPAIVGDLTRLVRIPNTINIKSHKYCIAITYDMLMNYDYEKIYQLASHKGPCYDYYNGHKLLDISKWDGQKYVKNNTSCTVNTKTILSNDIPPCVKKMMEDKNLGWKNRIFVITCLRDLGYTKDEIESILYNFLTEEKFHHSVFEEKQLERLVDNEDILFASCRTLKESNLCVDNNCQGHNIYY